MLLSRDVARGWKEWEIEIVILSFIYNWFDMEKEKEAKRIAAWKAVELIRDGMVIGLGTGSTAYFAIQRIAEKVKHGFSIKAIASSKASEDLAREAGIQLIDSSGIHQLDMGIDGADEVDPNGYLIKGGGGALVREKILAYNCREFIVIVDESKLVKQLGKFPLPVEVIPFSYTFAVHHLQLLGCTTQLRMKNNSPYITDNGNYIIDCSFGTIPDPGNLTVQINMIAGVVDNGIFDKKLVGKVVTNLET
jgi:ribose 5-phosphate isomerase A